MSNGGETVKSEREKLYTEVDQSSAAIFLKENLQPDKKLILSTVWASY